MELQKIKKQKRLITIIYLTFLGIIVSVFTFFVLYQSESKYAGLIFFLVLIPMFGLSLYFKPKIELLNNRYYLLLLLEEEILPKKYKQNVYASNWPQNVLTKGKYFRALDTKDYLLLYKTDRDPYKPKKKKQQILELILIHKNQKESFYISEVNEKIIELENTLLKEYKHKSVVLLQFMPVNSFESVNDIIKDLTYYYRKNTFYLTLNVAINTKEKEALYVDGENKMYIHYFSYALKLLNNNIQ